MVAQLRNRKQLGKPVSIPIDIRADILRLQEFRERGELCQSPKWKNSREKKALGEEIEETVNTALHDLIA